MGYHWDTGIAERPAELPRKEAPPMMSTAEAAPVRWFQRPVSLGWLLAFALVGVFGLLFSVGLTLHEAYDAQVAMGASMAPPPFNSLFESIHNVLAAWLWGLPTRTVAAWMWGHTVAGWMWNLPHVVGAWMWGGLPAFRL